MDIYDRVRRRSKRNKPSNMHHTRRTSSRGGAIKGKTVPKTGTKQNKKD
jgi:hypothetical protein